MGHSLCGVDLGNGKQFLPF